MCLNQKRGKPNDICSSGILIYYATTQKIPFENESQILYSEPKPIENVFSKKFKEILYGMLNKIPKCRLTAKQILESEIFIEIKKELAFIPGEEPSLDFSLSNHLNSSIFDFTPK